MKLSHSVSLFITPIILFGMVAIIDGCSDGGGHADHAHHKHEAKYGGALVAIGDHFAHLEFVFDKETGKLTMHVWDGEVEKPVYLEAAAIEIKTKEPRVTLSLKAIESENAGWKVGHSPSFEATSEQLKGKAAFDAVVSSIKIKGQTHENLAFNSKKGDGKH